MKFTAVIPLYNKAEHIGRALRSALSQTCQDFEVIVVDDGSTDGGGDIVRGFNDTRIHLIRQDNAGVSAARNLGIAEARGKWIAFLDADDAWKPHYLETIWSLTDKYPKAGAYATGYEIVLPSRKVIRPKYADLPSAPWDGLLPSYFRSSMGFAPVWTGATTVPRQIFQEVGGFAAGVPLGEDVDMWGRIALKYSFAYSSEVCASYYKYGGGQKRLEHYYSTNLEPIFVRTARETIIRGEITSSDLKDLNEYIARLELGAGLECFVDGRDPAAARRIILKARPKSARLKWRKCRTLLQTYLPISSTRFVHRVKEFLAP